MNPPMPAGPPASNTPAPVTALAKMIILHGGLTEIGDAGETDMRAISGHKQISTTLIYNKVSAAKARRIAEVRRKHIAELGEAEADDVS